MKIFIFFLKILIIIICVSIPTIIGNTVIEINPSEIVNTITHSNTKQKKKQKRKITLTYISHEKFYNQIAKIESKGNYNIASKHEYIGKYQASEGALRAFGLATETIEEIKKSINTEVSKSGKSYYTFNVELFPEEKQEEFIRWYMKEMEYKHLRNIIRKYAGKEFKGIYITKAGILYASMMGYGNVQSFFLKKSNFSSAIKQRLKKYEHIELLSE